MRCDLDVPEMSTFESDLERGLHELYDPYLAEQPPARRLPQHGRASIRVAGGLGGALAVKLATGAAIAALAAGAGVEAANTHSLNPVDWGRAVSRQAQGLPSTAGSPAVHTNGAPGAARTPKASPVAVPSTKPEPVSVPPVKTPSLPTVSPIAIPTVPTAVPKLP